MTKLILWCRKQGITWNQLTVAGITIDGSDMKMTEGLPPPKDVVQPRKGMFQTYGGPLLEQAADSEGMTSVVQEDE